MTNINQKTDQKHKFLTYYCQNISGAKTKVQRINELLTKSTFHAIAFQETWFGEEINDIEITKNTSYVIFRQDRSETAHHKVGGGGVATLIKSEFKVKRHSFNEIKILQYICLEVVVSDSIIFMINVYSPFGYPTESNLEIDLLLTKIEKMNKEDTIIVGDFNMPSIKWSPDLELPGVFLPKGSSSDELFINTLFDHDLKQIAMPPAGRNHLNLALVSNEKTSHCNISHY